MHIRKGYIRQNFQGLHLKQQHQQKNPHIISVAVSEKERENKIRLRKDRDRRKKRNEKAIRSLYISHLYKLERHTKQTRSYHHTSCTAHRF